MSKRVVVLVAVTGLLVCSLSWAENPPQLVVNLDRSFYALGESEPVGISILAHNPSPEPAEVVVYFDWWVVEIVTLDGEVVAVHQANQNPWDFPITFSWEPYEYRELDRVEWWRDSGFIGVDDGPEVSPGIYRVVVRFPTVEGADGVSPLEAVSEPLRILYPEEVPNEVDHEVVYIPAVANNAGLEGTFWRSELSLQKTTPWHVSADVTVALLEPGRDNSSPRTATLEFTHRPYPQHIPNVLETLFGYSGTAALRLDLPFEGFHIWSRTYTAAERGDYGQSIPVLRARDVIDFGTTGLLQGLAYHPGGEAEGSSGFRTNMGFLSLCPEQTTFEYVLFDPDLHTVGGNHLVHSVTLPPFGYRQLTRVLETAGSEAVTNAFGLVRTTTDRCGILAYAPVIDNASGDARFVTAEPVSRYSVAWP